MAKTKYDVVLSGANIIIPTGDEVELIQPLDGGHDQFKARWQKSQSDAY